MKTIKESISTIREFLDKDLEIASDLLLEATRNFSTSTRLEDEVVMLKWEYVIANDDRKQDIINRYKEILTTLEREYNAEKVDNKQKRIEELNQVSEASINNEIIVRLDGIIKKYSRRSSFELNIPKLKLSQGKIVGLVGENATGKSTLLNIIAGEVSHDSGTIRFPLFKEKRWVKIKSHISYIPQQLDEWQGSLLENISFHAALHGIKGEENDKAVKRIIHLLGLGDYTQHTWKELSGGYKLRFALAKALVWKPKLLILDEPLAHLDINAQITVLNDLKQLSKNRKHPLAILVSSQHIHEIEYIADKLLFMKNGKLTNQSISDTHEPNLLHFELGCNLDSHQLRLALSKIPDIQVTDKEMYNILSVPQYFTTNKILGLLITEGIEINYFRNISQSIKLKFYETKRNNNT